MYDVPSSSRIFPTAFFVLLLAGFALLLAPTSVVAQLGGENVRGDVGLKSGSQAPPGWYIGDMFYFYGTDEIRLNNGDALSGPKLNLFGDFLLVNYVSKKKLLGADYGFAVAVAGLNSRLDLPRLNVSTATWGFGDMYVQPLQLGWHFKHADAILGYAFYAPVGRFTAGANDNTGLGMWSNEFSGGTTVYFDPEKKWHASSAGYYEIHSSKFDLDQKVGDLFTAEGGVGRSFRHGLTNLGMAYFGQWKVTEDSGADVSPLVAGLKGSMVGLGPEFNTNLGKHPVFLTFRYLFDVRSYVATQGQSLFASIVYAKPSIPPPPIGVTCSTQPSEVLSGEPVTVTATGKNFNPKHPLTYNWSSTGGKVSGSDTTATIDTNGLAGGEYTATAQVSDPKLKEHGLTSCMVKFTVKELPKNPPTMSCSANPASVRAGETATITCNCTSPDSAQVSVASWNASGGTLSPGTGTTSLNTTGASGPITVSATCTDARGLATSANTQVNVEAPPPPTPQANRLSECSFPNQAKPWRVDNTCKAALDDVAQAMKSQADTSLVIVGESDAAETRKNLAAERAVNSKAYLVGGEAKLGIDPTRIETRTGTSGAQRAEFWLVPAGATFNQSGTQTVDENEVKPVPDHPRTTKKKTQ